MNTADVMAIFPEFDWIKDKVLKEKCLQTWVEACKAGQWTKESLCRLPFVVTELKDCPVTLVEHVRNVTKLAVSLQEKLNEMSGKYVATDRDTVVAAALLHDVGKLIEYTYKDGQMVYSDEGQYLRHPLAGAILAERCGVPSKIVHIIATHSFEGEHSYRTPEAFIIRNADWLNFDFLAFKFPCQMAHK